jgi:hypothetical protein
LQAWLHRLGRPLPGVRVTERVVNIRDLGRVGTWPSDVRRIDRRSPYGNPFRIVDMMWPAVALGHRNDDAGRRAASIALYRAWLTQVPIVVDEPWIEEGGSLEYSDGTVADVSQIVSELAWVMARPIIAAVRLPARPDFEPLRGKRLACWCAPLPCHGDVIVEMLGE